MSSVGLFELDEDTGELTARMPAGVTEPEPTLAPAATGAATTTTGQTDPTTAATDLTAAQKYELQNRSIDLQQQAIDIAKSQAQAAIQAGYMQAGLAATSSRYAEEEATRARERYAEYKDTYLPRERQFVRESFEGLRTEPEAASAGQAVIQSFDKGVQMARRDLARLGIDPSSPRYAGLLQNLTIARSAAEAGARNEARRDVRDINWARKQYAVGLGKGLPSEAASMTAAAGPLISGASSARSAGLGGTQMAAGGVSDALGGLASTYGNWYNAAQDFSRQAALNNQGYRQQYQLGERAGYWGERQVEAGRPSGGSFGPIVWNS